jgi:MFS superfamily sulfate permease-like transporter
VVLDASGIHEVDVSALTTLREVQRALAVRHIELHFAALTGPVRDIFARSGFREQVGRERFSFTVDEAVRRALGQPVALDPRVWASAEAVDRPLEAQRDL